MRTQAMGKSELLSQPGCLSLTDNYFFKTTMSIADEDAGSVLTHYSGYKLLETTPTKAVYNLCPSQAMEVKAVLMILNIKKAPYFLRGLKINFKITIRSN
ncbi:MAG: hypothetical protein JWR67_2293 [Mucilaginibacter sp.]|nr:hypothetical protein [Mucilaginibacter sp.]